MTIRLLLFSVLVLGSFFTVSADAASLPGQQSRSFEKRSTDRYESGSLGEIAVRIASKTGIYAMFGSESDSVKNEHALFSSGVGRLVMFALAFLLFYLAVARNFEPLLLIPIGFGALLANIPLVNMSAPDGFLGIVYEMGIANELFPLLIFMGLGAMTDFGPLLSSPRTALLGGAAQFGIFGTFIGISALSQYLDAAEFSLRECASISMIGSADGPTSIFVASILSPELLGTVAVAAYSYMALVPVIQPPIMKALTSAEERRIVMKTDRKIGKMEKLMFPVLLLMLSALFLPASTPLIGAFAFGNFVRESGVAERLSNVMQNSLIDIVTIFLGLGVGSRLQADSFLLPSTLWIMLVGVVAFSAGTASGVLMGKAMNRFLKEPVNPLIGAAGVSAVPMAARVVSRVGAEARPGNTLLMHAMGPNVAGIIGSAVAAGVLLSIFN